MTKEGDSVLGKWKVGGVLAVGWSDEMRQRFPNIHHDGCRVNQRTGNCLGPHCPRCGKSTDTQGGHFCNNPDGTA